MSGEIAVTGDGREQASDTPPHALVRVMVTPEVVDLVYDLGELSRFLVEHTRRVMAGEPVQGWADVAAVLDAVAEACRRRDVDDDSGR